MTKIPISISKLENVRKNPLDFAKNLKEGKANEPNFGNYPKSMRWLNAICEYHKNSNSLTQAFNSIENGFKKRQDNAQNRKEVNQFNEAISIYEVEHLNKELQFLKSREPINFTVNDSIKISGWIPLVYMKATKGFSAFFISQSNPFWEGELKYPLIQYYVAKQVFDTNIEDIDVGYIDYYSGEFHATSFSQEEIEESVREIQSLGKTILEFI